MPKTNMRFFPPKMYLHYPKDAVEQSLFSTHKESSRQIEERRSAILRSALDGKYNGEADLEEVKFILIRA